MTIRTWTETVPRAWEQVTPSGTGEASSAEGALRCESASVCTQISTSSRIFQRFFFLSDTSWRAAHTLSWWFQIGLSKSFHQVFLADLHSWVSRHGRLVSILHHNLLRVNCALSGGMNIPQPNTGYEPNQWDWRGWRVCSDGGFHTWRWRHPFSYDRHPVAALRECQCFVKIFCIDNVLTSWGRLHAEGEESLSDTVSDEAVYCFSRRQGRRNARAPNFAASSACRSTGVVSSCLRTPSVKQLIADQWHGCVQVVLRAFQAAASKVSSVPERSFASLRRDLERLLYVAQVRAWDGILESINGMPTVSGPMCGRDRGINGSAQRCVSGLQLIFLRFSVLELFPGSRSFEGVAELFSVWFFPSEDPNFQ